MNFPSLDKYDNSWYKPGGNILSRLVWYYINLWFIKCHWIPLSSVKCLLLRTFGAKIGKGVVIKPGVSVKYPWRLSIGDYTWIGEDVWIDNLDDVAIGSNCCISQGAMLLCGNHNYKKSSFDLITKPITIGDGAWVGAKSVVCPGVTLQKGAILSVGSVATIELMSGDIYQGNPASFKRKRL